LTFRSRETFDPRHTLCQTLFHTFYTPSDRSVCSPNRPQQEAHDPRARNTHETYTRRTSAARLPRSHLPLASPGLTSIPGYSLAIRGVCPGSSAARPQKNAPRTLPAPHCGLTFRSRETFDPRHILCQTLFHTFYTPSDRSVCSPNRPQQEAHDPRARNTHETYTRRTSAARLPRSHLPLASPGLTSKPGYPGSIRIVCLGARGLAFEQPPLALQAPAVTGELAVAPNDAMARHDDRQGVRSAGVRHGAHGARPADLRRQIGIRRRRSR